VLLVSTALAAVAMLFLGLGDSPSDLMIAMSLYGLAHGITSPTLFAWATDLSDERFKGRGISSLYIFMEFGIGVGAFASGLIFSNNTENFFLTFIFSSVLAFMAFLYLILFGRVTPKEIHVKTDEASQAELDQL
jgi:MFS family permease